MSFEPNRSIQLPPIIQGGMGVAVSGWQLARSVSSRGQIGVVSGTALDIVVARRLQAGDPGGDIRRALAAFPDQEMANRVLDKYFVEGGKDDGKAFKAKPLIGHENKQRVNELMVVSNFVEVFLAKEGHDGLVGINFLQKITTPLLASMYGALLADVDIMIVGAGIPMEIPKILDQYLRHEPGTMKLPVKGATDGKPYILSFDPADIFPENPPALRKPLFFPIVSSVTLATLLINKCEGPVDGLILEGPTAGGHNAPPRGLTKLNEKGEPIYGPRDEIDLDAINALDRPYFLAGGYGSPDKLKSAQAAGATGIQIGTLFAFSNESGLRPDLKSGVIEGVKRDELDVFTDPVASPTGFPFKVVSLPGTHSSTDTYHTRKRVCDLGYLREAYQDPDGEVAWRCSSDDVDIYQKSGGKLEDTAGRKCLCNGLMANIGLPQFRNGEGEELPLITCGDDVSSILQLLGPDGSSYSCIQVIDYLLSEPNTAS